MWNSSACSIVACRSSRVSTTDVARSPRLAPSSEKLISALGGSARLSLVTKAPRPAADSISPSSTSAAKARRTVVRLTESCWHSSRSAGSRSPGRSVPLAISSAIIR